MTHLKSHALAMEIDQVKERGIPLLQNMNMQKQLPLSLKLEHSIEERNSSPFINQEIIPSVEEKLSDPLIKEDIIPPLETKKLSTTGNEHQNRLGSFSDRLVRTDEAAIENIKVELIKLEMFEAGDGFMHDTDIGNFEAENRIKEEQNILNMKSELPQSLKLEQGFQEENHSTSSNLEITNVPHSEERSSAFLCKLEMIPQLEIKECLTTGNKHHNRFDSFSDKLGTGEVTGEIVQGEYIKSEVFETKDASVHNVDIGNHERESCMQEEDTRIPHIFNLDRENSIKEEEIKMHNMNIGNHERETSIKEEETRMPDMNIYNFDRENSIKQEETKMHNMNTGNHERESRIKEEENSLPYMDTGNHEREVRIKEEETSLNQHIDIEKTEVVLQHLDCSEIVKDDISISATQDEDEFELYIDRDESMSDCHEYTKEQRLHQTDRNNQKEFLGQDTGEGKHLKISNKYKCSVNTVMLTDIGHLIKQGIVVIAPKTSDLIIASPSLDQDSTDFSTSENQSLQRKTVQLEYISNKPCTINSNNERMAASRQRNTSVHIDMVNRQQFVSHSEEKLYSCDLTKHKTVQPGERLYTCDVCHKAFQQHSHLRKHKITHSEERHYSCDVCNKAFKTNSDLNKHKAIHTEEKPYACDVCHKAFHENKKLKRHIRTHTGERPYSCDICDKAFHRHSHLKYHKSTHTTERPYSCDVCHKTFKQHSNLKRHTNTHIEERQYSCDVCHKAFYHNSQLKTHKRTHSKERPYSCDVCHKAFKQHGHLNTHKSTHTNDRPYSCDVCNKAFKTNSHLKEHRIIHTEEKPFTCDVCHKAFLRPRDLEKHKITHSDEGQYSCDVCSKAFKTNSDLNKHKKTHL